MTPDQNAQARFLERLYLGQQRHQSSWEPVNWIPTTTVATGPTAINTGALPLVSFQAHGKTFVRSLLEMHQQTFVSNYTMPEWVLDETDKRRKNKIARKNRDAAKASHNATGRKWWEHR